MRDSLHLSVFSVKSVRTYNQKSALNQRRVAWASFFLGCMSWLAFASPVRSADKIYVSYGILERSIAVSSLEEFVKNGSVDDDLAVYAQYGDANQLQRLKSALVARADIEQVAISQFLYSPQGEVLLKRLGQVIQPESRGSGFKAIRAALILAASDPDGLTLLNVLRHFPTRGLRIDVERSLQIAASLEQLVSQTQRATTVINQEGVQEQATDSTVINQLDDLRQQGPFTWQKQTIELVDPSRSAVASPPPSIVRAIAPDVPLSTRSQGRAIPVDLYLPNQGQSAATVPVVVISHGLGSDRTTFAYLARHLASYGFAVLVPEHPGSNAQQIQALLNGTAREVTEPAEFIDRPLDITFVLNQVESLVNATPTLRGRFNFQQVGVLGQSFGGYTALALAGAPINAQQLQTNCQDLENTLNVSLLLQCRLLDLKQTVPNLKDNRVKAILAINPVTSAIFGQTSISQIAIPTLIVTGSADTIAPAVTEQILPFTWLTTEKRYLVMLQGGTHFSTIDSAQSAEAIPLPDSVIGPNPAIARRYIDALSVAFFQTYIANKPTYRSYLSASYSNAISEAPMPLSLIQTLTLTQLSQDGSAPPALTTTPPVVPPTPPTPIPASPPAVPTSPVVPSP